MKHSSARGLTEGAVLVAFFAVLLLISIYIPPLALVVNLFLVLPYIIYSSKYPLKSTLIMVAAGIGVSGIIGSLLAIPLAIAYSTTGAAIGWMIKENKSKLMIFLVSTVIFLFHAITQYVISIFLLGINVIEEMFTVMDETYERFLAMSESSGIDVAELQSNWTTHMNTIEMLLPTLLVFGVAVMVWIIITVNLPIAKRFSIQVPKFTPFRELSLPKSVIWYYLIILITTLVSSPEQGSLYAMAVLNLQVGLEIILILQGLSFIHFFAHLKGWGKGLIVLLTIFGIVLSPFTRILGIIDLGFDLRKRLQQ
ncbi:YybS family protein [Jeotgalibacillus proteolyticus]|uniref:DUF2232 domain-containing protein n=1 Tax=Jeotgalibacillus proteolyticus TaxID=2082395 RepID=A0A2S5G685_9BACL|nr:YybS family protein [Jeotgalibacillus proteolyticus]PPA68496.1 DUF2232 domain-containing protein [Jeotgalibacillus proteolyticus]